MVLVRRRAFSASHVTLKCDYRSLPRHNNQAIRGGTYVFDNILLNKWVSDALTQRRRCDVATTPQSFGVSDC